MLLRVHAAHFYLCRHLRLPPRGAGLDPAPLSWPGPPHKGGTGFALCCIMGCQSQLDLAGVQDSVRSPAEIVQSWQWQWQGTAGVQRAPRTSFWFCIYSGKNKPLRCYNGIQLTNWKTSSILQGNKRLSVLDVCSKIIFSLNILYISIHMHI